jgi:hypothetical protein
MLKRVGICVLGIFGFAAPAIFGSIYQSASPYTDALADQVGSTNKLRDLAGATITNDATNLYITFSINSAGNLTNGGNFNYGIGITTGSPTAGGDTSAAADHGNPYSRAISIDPSLGGMMDWIGVFGAGPAGANGGTVPFTSYGFNDYVYGTPGSSEPAGVWTKIDTVSSGEPIGASNTSITLTVPMADFVSNLVLTPGTTIDFDIYSTGTSAGQTAYDSLADQSPTNATNSATTQYNGTVLDSYTIAAVPEPATLGLAAIACLGLLKRRNFPRE